MNSLVQNLIKELKTNKAIQNSAVVKIILEYINNASNLGVPSDQILNTAISNLEAMSKESINENLKDVVTKFKRLSNKPTARLQNMAKEAGLSMKLKMLKESSIAKDPTFLIALREADQLLAVAPEFRIVNKIIESFNRFAYDSKVNSVLNELNSYVNTNKTKLVVMNAIYEMRQTNSMIYKDAINILERALLNDEYSADALKMNLRGRVNMPITNRLINNISMLEASDNGTFNIGIGDSNAKVLSVIAPFHKITNESVIILLENAFVKLDGMAEPIALTPDQVKTKYPQFYEVCESFASLNFKNRDNEIYSKGRNLEVSFKVNEDSNLQLRINNKTITDLAAVNLTELFVLEQLDTRNHLVKLFNNLDSIVNLEFAKKLVNERLNADSIVFTINDTQFVFEKMGNTRIIKKMEGLAFHSYVMENFKYDISDLYSIQLEQYQQDLKDIETEKELVEDDIEKLEESIEKLDETLKNFDLSDDYRLQLNDLKSVLDRNIIDLKNHYIMLEQDKKKL